MRRLVLALIVVVTLIASSSVSVPVIAQLGEVRVTLTCSDGIEITDTTLVVSLETLTQLTSTVEAMTLYPAGLVCRLKKAPLLSSSASLAGGLIGPLAAFAESPPKDFVVGGGRFMNCQTFAVSAHSDNVNSPGTVTGSFTESVPQDDPLCATKGHLKAKVVCLSVVGNVARINGNVVESSGFFASAQTIQALFIDNGNPATGPPADLISFNTNMPGPAPVNPPCNFLSGNINPISNGNVTVHDAP